MKFLNYLKPMSMAYYLRPVTAIWRAYEAAYFDLSNLWGGERNSSWAELGVGDGLQAAIASGISINERINAYTHMSPNWSQARMDKDNRIDVFDEAPVENVSDLHALPNEIMSPWALGIDHKDSLLKKAEKLQVFKQLRKRNMNSPENLFEAGEKFDLIFSNSLYWSRYPREVLLQIRKHTTQLYLSLKLSSYSNHLIGTMQNMGAFGAFLDHGRSKHDGVNLQAEEWLKLLEETGFVVEDFLWHAPAGLVSAIEWCDQREWAPMIAKLANDAELGPQQNFQKEMAAHIEHLGFLAYENKLLQANSSSANYILVKASVRL